MFQVLDIDIVGLIPTVFLSFLLTVLAQCFFYIFLPPVVLNEQLHFLFSHSK